MQKPLKEKTNKNYNNRKQYTADRLTASTGWKIKRIVILNQ